MIDRRQGYDVGAGSVKEGDTVLYQGKPCKVLTVYQDGDVQIDVGGSYQTVKWRFVTPNENQLPMTTTDIAITDGDRRILLAHKGVPV